MFYSSVCQLFIWLKENTRNKIHNTGGILKMVCIRAVENGSLLLDSGTARAVNVTTPTFFYSLIM